MDSPRIGGIRVFLACRARYPVGCGTKVIEVRTTRTRASCDIKTVDWDERTWS